MKILLALLLCMVSSAFAVDARSVIPAAPFNGESHPNDDGTIKGNAGGLGWVHSNTWVRYDNLSFGSEPLIQIRIKASTPNGGSTINVRNGSPSGPLIATVAISSTGDWNNYRDFIAVIDPSFKPSGNQNSIVFEFIGGGGRDLMNVAEFSFATTSRSWRSDIFTGAFLQESAPANSAIIEKSGDNLINITDDSWVDYGLFDFDPGISYAWIEASASTDSPQGVQRQIEFRTGSKDGPIIGSVEVPNTKGRYVPLGVKFSTAVTGVKRFYMTFQGGTGNLFNVAKFRFQTLAPDYKPAAPITARIVRDAGVFPWTAARSYTHESAPNNDGSIAPYGDGVGWISANTWVRYADYNVPAGANRVSIQTYSNNPTSVEMYLGPDSSTQAPTGNPIATFNIQGGSQSNPQSFTKAISALAAGPQNVFFKFNGNLDFVRFQFEAKTSTAATSYSALPSGSSGVVKLTNDPEVITVTDGDWARYDKVNFGQDANIITVTAATPNKGGTVEARLDSPSGPLIATIDVTHTGSLTNYREYAVALSRSISGTQDLYLKFVNTFNQSGDLFNLKNFIVEKKAQATPAPTHQGTLTVYDPVPGLDPSPYYTYSVQKVSAFNAPLKQNATNWLRPYAWFTECKISSDPYTTAYYMGEIAGWSHTYCNFELGKNTPIVVKITRKSSNPHGAPAGPIFMANVHPAHLVESCEIINGEVYVTMREPAFVTVDIDGQMDARDAPRSSPAEMASSKPYASREKGSHAVSIFANPVISAKPATASPKLPTSGPILYIEPGGNAKTKINSRDDWTTVYFLPGVHSFSGFETNGKPKKIEPGDQCPVKSDRNYYIPGDAMVYGCFSGNEVSNVRFFGLGTVSGRFIPHYQDAIWTDPKCQTS